MGAAVEDFEMEVGSGGVAGGADLAQDICIINVLSLSDVNFVHVSIEGNQSLAVIDDDVIAIRVTVIVGGLNLSGHDGLDRIAYVSFEVYAGVP